MKKQAKLFQEQMAKMQEDMQKLEVTGSAGNGLVEITLTGEKEIKKLNIKPECVDHEDVEGLQDLIIVAFNDAAKKIEDNSPQNGLSMSGLPFGL
ncbi:Nucleoid-associated protein [Candidatus Neptunochlamydia vexilliferae]|uniref:Nucleoid-associated protein NEPTK9_001282 n=2 Tax=Candidatus Neptunichlamydia vexilliferae TaxID=1651774 RepID=A0ABS0B055_9BACT|nr:Nucleoid-associated protein [Candidatus Neptunochlamydia vexilliferae]